MNKRWLGLFWVISGSIFWGASGTVTDLTLATNRVSPLWIVSIGFIISGILLLTSYKLINHQPIFKIWADHQFKKRLVAFGILGMMPTQLLYFIAIQFSNAATATVLQFTGPVFIIIYLAFKNRQLPNKMDSLSVLIAVTGTFLLATRGNLSALAISTLGLFFGLSAGLASAIYTLLPGKMLKNYDAKLICGWGFLLGSIPLLPFIITTSQPHFDASFTLELLFIIIIGTMLAYLFYVASIDYLSPAVSGVLASFEPLTATFLSVFFLHLRLNGFELLGIALILLMAVIQAIPESHK
ncbi:DMT family transporter [Lactobacillaceae bacterium Melli_B4]